MKLTIQGFSGMAPKLHPRMLPDNMAQVASLCRFDNAALEPFGGAVEVATNASAMGSFAVLYDGSYEWFTESDVDMVEAPIAAKRYYLTGKGTRPQMWNAGAYVDLAVLPPTAAPTLTPLGVTDPATAETIVYAYTWVTNLGEESALSPLSAEIVVSPDQVITISGLPTSPPAGGRGNAKRVYRSKTSFSGATELFFVAQVNLLVPGFNHDLSTQPYQEAITSTDYDAPPDSMKGITAMPNGFFAAFTGKEVLFSEPYIPHAWPEKYRLSVNDDIVGLVAFGTSLAVLTTGAPYIIQGLHPDAMSQRKMESIFPCASKRGIVDLGYAAIYPSTDGLVQINESGAQLVSQPIWRPEQWWDMEPSTMVAAPFRGGYVFAHKTPNVASRMMSMLVLDGSTPTVVDWKTADPSTYIDLHYNAESGKLYGLQPDGKKIFSIGDQDVGPTKYEWRSKVFRIPAPMPFGVLYIDGMPPAAPEVPFFSAKVYANGVEIASISTANTISRLPPPSTPTDIWEVSIAGNYTVTRLILCGDPSEIFT